MPQRMRGRKQMVRRGASAALKRSALSPADVLYGPVLTLVRQSSDPLRRAVLTRVLRVASSALESATPTTLSKAASAESDVKAVVTAFEATLPDLSQATDEDVIARGQLRGLEVQQRVLEAEGGTLSAAEVAQRLRLTRQAVDLRRRHHRLIGLAVGRRGYRYPAWQFGRGGTLAWVPRVLEALAPHDPWQQVFFLLSPHPDLAGQTPLTTLREGRTDDVVALARTYAAYGLG